MNIRYETIETSCCVPENGTSAYADNNKYFSFFQINHESRELRESPLQNMECAGENDESMDEAHLDVIGASCVFYWWERCGVPFGISSPFASLSPRCPV